MSEFATFSQSEYGESDDTKSKDIHKKSDAEIQEMLKDLGFSLPTEELHSEFSAAVEKVLQDTVDCVKDYNNSPIKEYLWFDEVVYSSQESHDYGVKVGINDTEEYLQSPAAYPVVEVPSVIEWDGSEECSDVIGICDFGFCGCTNIVDVILPYGIYYIGQDAFFKCTQLRNINFPDSLEYIGYDSFFECTKLEKVVFPNSLKVISEGAFLGSGLKEIIIPDSVLRIGPHAFQNTPLETIIFTNPSIEIDYTAFDECKKIKTVVAPLALAGTLSVLFQDIINWITFKWIDSGCENLESDSIKAEITSIESDTYTNGTSGVTIHYRIENTCNRTVAVDVKKVFLVRSSGIESFNYWLKDAHINNVLLKPNCYVEGAAVITSDKIRADDFIDLHKIGIAVSVDWKDYTTDEHSDRTCVFESSDDSPGDWEEILDLHWNNIYTAMFMHMGGEWKQYLCTIPHLTGCDEDNTPSEIQFVDFVVRVNLFNCNYGHHIEPLNAHVRILHSDGSISTENISAGYCQECNCYFILEPDFLLLQRKGVLLCHLMTEEEYRTKGEAIMSGTDMKAQSVLRRCGYTVNAKDNLSEEQRRGILVQAVESGLYSVNEITGFLDWLIDYHGRSRTRNMSAAISKWSSDRNYISNYQISSRRNVGIGSIQYKAR